MKYLTLRTFYLLTLLLLFSGVKAQISTNEIPVGLLHGVSTTQLASRLIFYNPDTISNKHLQDDEYPMLAGVSLKAGILFTNNATATPLPDGQTLWHLKIHVPGAPFLGVVFSNFSLRENERLFIYDENGQHHIGAFTSENNPQNGLFSTQILPASTLIVEVYSPWPDAPAFVIDEMIYIWSDYVLANADLSNKSGICNVNINCPEGENWQKQKRGVARILLRQGTSWFNCSGSLVNNTKQDQTPFFLTADHCGPNASADDLSVWQFHFNDESPTCTTTAPINRRSITGAVLQARAPLSGGTDFKLLKLNQAPQTSWNAYYNGWSRSSRNPESGVTIHHPAGDVKKISTYTAPLTNATFTGGMTLGFWRVVWVETISGYGVTEGGSSGSPLFDQIGLITGTLTGGSATCSQPSLPDLYGKFYLHWNANGETPDRRLQPWLDPLNVNPEILYGLDASAQPKLVTLIASPVEGGIVTGGGLFLPNEVVRISAQPSEGYTFVHWKDQNDVVVSANPEFEFLMPDAEVFLTALFRKDSDPYVILIYPNPVDNHDLYIKFPTNVDWASVKITHINGQNKGPVFFKDFINDHILYINTIYFASGIYILSIETSLHSTHHKIVIVK
jgi:hypothetical protein